MATIHERRSSIEYSLRSREEYRRLIPGFPERFPCRLLEAFNAADNGDILFTAPCFSCSGFWSPHQYLQFCERRLIYEIRSRFPAVQGYCAEQVADSFRQIIEDAHATHRCPSRVGHGGVRFATTHVVEFLMWEADRAAIEESFQEAAAARLRPADKDSVRELFKARVRDDVDDKESRGECVICLEEMKTRESVLRMPCSHSFHEACLVRWLDANHVCPLCRYELPAPNN